MTFHRRLPAFPLANALRIHESATSTHLASPQSPQHGGGSRFHRWSLQARTESAEAGATVYDSPEALIGSLRRGVCGQQAGGGPRHSMGATCRRFDSLEAA